MRVRITYSKENVLKYTGALDVQAIWQRSLKRAGLSVEHSQGFHPQPKIQLPFPLPLGFTAQNEIIDIWFSESYKLAEIEEKLAANLPNGIKIQELSVIDGAKRSISSSAIYADYLVKVDKNAEDCHTLKKLIRDLLGREEIQRVRNKKPYDLRPLIISIDFEGENNGYCQLNIRVSANPSKTGRPDEVLKEIGLHMEDCEIERLDVHFES